MAITGGEQFYYKFNKGLFTEGGYLSSPVDIWTDASNVVPQLDGSVKRRKGIDYEFNWGNSKGFSPTTKQTLAFGVHTWNSVAGNGARNFIVVQIGSIVEFYDNIGETVASTRKTFTIDLSDYKPSTNPNATGLAAIETVSGNGSLIITSADTEPLSVAYNEDTADITVTQLDVKIRDFAGLDDALAVDENPTPLSAEHEYNLLNQGWLAAHITTYGTPYPSNAQQWVVGKDGSDVFTKALLDKHDFGTTPAPKGRFVIDLFSRNYVAVSGVAGITTLNEKYRPTTCAFFAGRTWFAGIQSDKISTYVLFSQVARLPEQFGYCHQLNDPTAEIIADLLDSDGGVIPIQDAGTILKLMPLGNSMLVFCDNGVWQIVSGESGFTATSYSVHKISSAPCVSAHSVVSVEDSIMFWSTSGIYALTYSRDANAAATGTYAVTSVTDATIKTVYQAISATSRKYAAGLYNEEEKIVYWAYDSDPDHSDVTDRYLKDSLMIFDSRMKAWYTQSFTPITSDTGASKVQQVESPYVYDMWLSKSRGSTSQDADVINGAVDDVIDTAGDQVIVTASVDIVRDRSQKFMATRYDEYDTRDTSGYLVDILGTMQEVQWKEPRKSYDPTTLVYDGVLIEAAKRNYVKNSEKYAGAGWTRTRSTVTEEAVATGPDGTAADALIEDGTATSTHFMNNAFTHTANTETLSCWAKPFGRDWIKLEMDDGTTVVEGYFDVTNGVAGVSSNGTTAITAYINGWYRCTLTSSAPMVAGAGGCSIYLADADNSDSYSGDSTSGAYIWGVQNEASAAARSYVPQRNIIIATEDWSDAAWVATDTTVTPDDIEAPNGTTTGDLITEGSATTAVTYISAAPITVDTTITMSYYIRPVPGTVSWVKLQAYDSGSATDNIECWYDIVNGVLGTPTNNGTGTNAAGTIEQDLDVHGNHTGWYRITLTGEVNNSAATIFNSMHSADADASDTRVAAAAYHVWGGQFESKSAASAYWASVLATYADRSADVSDPTWHLVASDWHNARTDNSKWVDWYSADANRELGAEWIPHVETGYEIQTSAGIRRLQTPAIYVFMPRTEVGLDATGAAIDENSVFMQTKWDWSDGTRANKWGVSAQAYKPRQTIFAPAGPLDGTLTDLPLVTSKLRPRGSGKALQFKFTGEARKDFQLTGWAVASQTHTPMV